MFDRIRRDEDGFTLIELLVVVIIIGILAAIAIPTFLNQRERGWEASAQADNRNAQTAIESCAIGNNGAYDAPTDCSVLANLANEGFNATTGVTTTVVAAAQSYTVNTVHATGGDQFTFDSTTGQMVRAPR